ncbi:MAG TPA: HisA/HisF-related TIM barrel protein, partial [Bacteroidota bacterium]|nr:HisA/HisF-related TIM barrel protein [Bacteroidota bacterium]
PIALAKVYEVAQAVDIPIFGIGGIATVEDAIEFLLVGASAVQIGTMNYVDPTASVRIAEGLRSHAEKNNLKDVGELVGALDANVESSVLQSWL